MNKEMFMKSDDIHW